MTDTPDFRFRIRRDEDATDRWTVNLPHQCEEWTITAESHYAEPPEHAEAVRHMEAFIAQAQVALAALRRREEQ